MESSAVVFEIDGSSALSGGPPFCVAATGAAKSIGIRPKENGSSSGQVGCNSFWQVCSAFKKLSDNLFQSAVAHPIGSL